LASNDVVAVGVVRIFRVLNKVGVVLRNRPAVSLEDLLARVSLATTVPRAARSHGVGKDSHPANLPIWRLAAVCSGRRG
jgi:hypothetical protein